jgi:hypothetical protein
LRGALRVSRLLGLGGLPGLLVVEFKVVVAFFLTLEDGGQKGFLYTDLRSSDGGYGLGDKEWKAAGSVMPSYLGHFCALLAQGV